MSEDRRKDEAMNQATGGELPAELKAFEARLAALAPSAGRLDRDAMLFEAGRASVRVAPQRRWAWPTAFGAMTTLAAVLLAMVLIQPEPQAVVKYVYVDRPAEPETTVDDPAPQLVDDAPSESYETPSTAPMRRQPSVLASAVRDWMGIDSLEPLSRQRQIETVLAQGADAILSPSDSAKGNGRVRGTTEPRSYRQWREELLEGAVSDRPTGVPDIKPFLKNGANL